METIQVLCNKLAVSLHPWMSEIATALVACVLIVLAPDINRALQRLVGARHFVVRTSLFILINAFGFGILIVWLAPQLAAGLRGLTGTWLVPVLVLSFIFIGVWAQRQRQL
ncbi:DUF3392 domain-containing protein [Shewanella sp. FJAT-52076]|uniref:DUF3392 domain-containing protein n=1 Tax=Shewanella sp. FJAT-52076 TaxID=2864202 RepID=UPI001C65A6A3|nr:DUF3392 domain-containing protein [Shewanella sp. FJAT-52076]QYJ74796.1 DUF3392 domain-containing protein [Shewanella sp. FJAT-52076]